MVDRFSLLRRRLFQGALLCLVWLSLLGCPSGSESPFTLAGRSFSATNMTLGALRGNLQLNTAAGGNGATGTLNLIDPTRQANLRTRIVIASPTCNGTYDLTTGAVNLTGSFENPTGTAHNFTVTGTLPTLGNNNQGSITITIDGTAYGPFIFGDNTPGGGNNGGNQTGLIISGSSANSPSAVNGVYTGTVGVEKFVQSFTLNGVTYDGQHNVVVFKQGSGFALDIFGLSITNGQSFVLPADRVSFTFLEQINTGGTRLYKATSGTVTVEAISATSMTVVLSNVKLTGQDTQSTGEFTVNGTLSGNFTGG